MPPTPVNVNPKSLLLSFKIHFTSLIPAMGKNSDDIPPTQYPFRITGQLPSQCHPAFALLEKGAKHNIATVHHKARDMSTSQAHHGKVLYLSSWHITIVKPHKIILCWEISHFKAILEATLIQTQWLSNA